MQVEVQCQHLHLLVPLVRELPLHHIGFTPTAFANNFGTGYSHRERYLGIMVPRQLAEAERRLHLQRAMSNRFKPLWRSGVALVIGIVGHTPALRRQLGE